MWKNTTTSAALQGPGSVKAFRHYMHNPVNSLCLHEDDGYTSSQADNSPQALPLPHDDGGQNLASQKAVLDTCRQGVEPLVTQHRYLVVQSAATHWKLERAMFTGERKYWLVLALLEMWHIWHLFDGAKSKFHFYKCSITQQRHWVGVYRSVLVL